MHGIRLDLIVNAVSALPMWKKKIPTIANTITYKTKKILSTKKYLNASGGNKTKKRK